VASTIRGWSIRLFNIFKNDLLPNLSIELINFNKRRYLGKVTENMAVIQGEYRILQTNLMKIIQYQMVQVDHKPCLIQI
jgi:hypothetical protein